MFRRYTLLGGVSLGIVCGAPPVEAHYVVGCEGRACKMHVIAPYKKSFLGPVGRCESGTTTNLRHGLRAVSPGGKYRGRYQFGMPDWRSASKRARVKVKLDPIRSGWVTQAYLAVVWLHVNGRQSWPNC